VRNTGRVSSDDDDEALTWVGGRDPSHYETPEVVASKRASAAKSVKPVKSAAPLATPEEDDDDVADVPAGTGSVVLVTLGTLGGVYLLYTVGWVVSWQRFLYSSDTELELIAFHVQQVLAILAAPLWFVATILLTRDRKPTTRLLWLLAGALVLVPWSFVFGR
jgi:hypothetical protein